MCARAGVASRVWREGWPPRRTLAILALLTQPLGARLLKGVVVALVPRDRAVVEMEDVGAHRVKEGARVAHHNERLVPALQVLLEPQHGV